MRAANHKNWEFYPQYRVLPSIQGSTLNTGFYPGYRVLPSVQDSNLPSVQGSTLGTGFYPRYRVLSSVQGSTLGTGLPGLLYKALIWSAKICITALLEGICGFNLEC